MKNVFALVALLLVSGLELIAEPVVSTTVTNIFDSGKSFDWNSGLNSPSAGGGDLYFRTQDDVPGAWANNVNQTAIGIVDDTLTPLDIISFTLGAYNENGDRFGGVLLPGEWTRQRVSMFVGRTYFSYLDATFTDVAFFRPTAVTSNSISFDYFVQRASPTPAPDSASSIQLLIASLIGLFALRRKLK